MLTFSTIAYLTAGPSNLIFHPILNKRYSWIPHVLPRLVIMIGLTTSEPKLSVCPIRDAVGRVVRVTRLYAPFTREDFLRAKSVCWCEKQQEICKSWYGISLFIHVN